VAKEPQQTRARQFLRNAHWGRAETLGKLGRHRDALADWDRAVELSAPPQRPLVRMGRALCRARGGEPGPATQAAEELLAAPQPPGDVLYEAACVFAVSAAAVADAEPRERYAARAVELLGRAHAAGYFQQKARAEHLKKDDDLTALRQRDDFQELLARIENG
jgi:hypothetical protein